MQDAEETLAQYDRLAAWVERERTRLEAAGDRPDQTFFRRNRLVTEFPRLDLKELLRELGYFA